MNIKLSTLAAIIAIIFFGYYYFIYAPAAQQQVSTHAGDYKEYTDPEPNDNDNAGVTPLDNGDGMEGFAVTSLLDDDGYDDDGYDDGYDDGGYSYDGGYDYDYADYAQPQQVESQAAPANSYDSNSVYDLAGNVRPDNVIEYDEPVTRL